MPPTGGTDELIVHGTAIALNGRAVLLRGASGAGKSDLALRALGVPGDRSAAAWQLVGDDQVVVRAEGGRLTVEPHPRLAGLIEVRGVGILPMVHVREASLVLIAELVRGAEVERLPDPWPAESLLGISVPVLRLAPFEASAPLKLSLALAHQPWTNKDC